MINKVFSQIMWIPIELYTREVNLRFKLTTNQSCNGLRRLMHDTINKKTLKMIDTLVGMRRQSFKAIMPMGYLHNFLHMCSIYQLY
ncbi:hypothetical protein LXL04_023732 [Taraxacum kok-saghyz]